MIVAYLAAGDLVVVVGIRSASLASVSDRVFGTIALARDDITSLTRMRADRTFWQGGGGGGEEEGVDGCGSRREEIGERTDGRRWGGI